MTNLHTSRWETAHVGSPVRVDVDESIDTSGGPDTGTTTRTVTVRVNADLSITEARRLRDDLDHAIDLAEDDGTGVLWATQPGWTRAHAIEHAGSMGAEQLWATQCNRDFPVPHPATDKPAPAPRDMPRCTHCSAALQGEFRG